MNCRLYHEIVKSYSDANHATYHSSIRGLTNTDILHEPTYYLQPRLINNPQDYIMRNTYVAAFSAFGILVSAMFSNAAGLQQRASLVEQPSSIFNYHTQASIIIVPRKEQVTRVSFVIYRPTSTTPLASATSTAVSIPSATPSDRPRNIKWMFNIESGNQGVQIGSWTPDVTHDGILRALRDRCSKNPKKWGQNRCSSQDYGFYVEYADKYGRQTEYKNAAKIHVTSDFIPESYGVAVQDVFMEQIADLYKFAIEEDKNCYTFDPKSTICMFCSDKLCVAKYGSMGGKSVTAKQRLRRWCNVPDYVRVAINDEAGKEKAHMKVELRFDCPTYLTSSGCKTGLGKHDCAASLERINRAARGETSRTELLKKATQGKEFDVAAKSSSKEVTGSCPNTECLYQLGACFK